MEGMIATAKHSVLFESAADEVAEDFQALDELIQKTIGVLANELEKLQENALNQLKAVRLAYMKKVSQQEASLIVQEKYAKEIVRKQKGADRKTSHKHLEGISAHSFTKRILVSIAKITLNNPIKPSSIHLNLPRTLIDFKNTKGFSQMVYSGFYPINRKLTTIRESMKFECGPGRIEHGLSNPGGMAIHPITGNIYVINNTSCQVVIYSAEIKPLGSFGKRGKEVGCFTYPTGVAISFDGERIAIADGGNYRIQIFDINYNFVKEIKCSVHGTSTPDKPFCVCYDAENNLYASMSISGVVKYSQEGEFISNFGENSLDIENPQGLMINDEGEIYVLPLHGNRVHVLGSNGAHHRDITVRESQDNWTFLTRGGGRSFVLSDCSGSYIDFYDDNGEKVNSIELQYPTGIAFGMDGKFYAIACGMCEVHVY